MSRKPSPPPQASDDDAIFEALNELAAVMLELKEQSETAAQAQRIDQAGARIVDALIKRFSYKSAQIEELMRERDKLRRGWGAQLRQDGSAS